MIRPANDEDLPALTALGRRMHDESPRWSRLSFDAARAHATLAMLLDNEDGLLLVAEHEGAIAGGIAAMCAPHWSSRDRVAFDLGLFLAPEARGGMDAVRLVRAYREWARGRGAVHITLGISTGVHAEQTGHLYERMGFTCCGQNYEVANVR